MRERGHESSDVVFAFGDIVTVSESAPGTLKDVLKKREADLGQPPYMYVCELPVPESVASLPKKVLDGLCACLIGPVGASAAVKEQWKAYNPKDANMPFPNGTVLVQKAFLQKNLPN